MIRPGELIAAVTLAGWGLCFAGVIALRHIGRVEIKRITTD